MFCKIRPIAIRNVQFAASAADQRQFKSLILIQNFCLGIDKCTYSICIIKKNGILKIIAGFSKLPVKRILFSFLIIDNTDRLCICTGIGIFVCQRPYYLFSLLSIGLTVCRTTVLPSSMMPISPRPEMPSSSARYTAGSSSLRSISPMILRLYRS